MKKKIKLLSVVGARPNFIKIAPLIDEFKKHKQIKSVLVHTGQHYDFEMSQIFFRELKITKIDYNLGVGSGSNTYQTAEIMNRLETVLLKEKPDLVVMVGDVNSTLAGALTAAKLHFPIAHIEAGLRSYDKTMPEEINRLLTDRISDFLFCPTKTAVENLKKEGIKKNVYNVGDIMYDVFLKNIKVAKDSSQILETLNLKPKNYLLFTLHRSSNVDDLKKLKRIIQAIQESGEQIVFPVHPRTKKQLKLIKMSKLNNFKIINPVSYFNMLILEKNAKKILTDSGGVQKEAYFLKTPCITLREKTEWVETVKDGWNVLVGSNRKKIIKEIEKFYPKTSQHQYFGDGKAAQKITKIILHLYEKKE